MSDSESSKDNSKNENQTPKPDKETPTSDIVMVLDSIDHKSDGKSTKK